MDTVRTVGVNQIKCFGLMIGYNLLSFSLYSTCFAVRLTQG
jgi:hypothetical protein